MPYRYNGVIFKNLWSHNGILGYIMVLVRWLAFLKLKNEGFSISQWISRHRLLSTNYPSKSTLNKNGFIFFRKKSSYMYMQSMRVRVLIFSEL